MGIELNNAWTEANRHRTKLISDFELRHECCGYNHISDRPFPPIAPKGSEKPKDRTCSENDAYGFKVACKADLTKDFERWHKGIRNLLLGQVTILLPLMLLVMTLSAINFLKLRGWKQEELEDAKTQAEASTIVPVVNGRGDTQYERPLLEDASPRNGETPFLVNVETEPARFTHDRPVVQPSLI
ncbi:hypothetical protein BCR41DRAFT_98183 [Lobosporangium transversale]|uniref:Tetraspanin family-domain-containing protein n=1 Tax=Lobosporangium transversale TaxID=64571 RepID=A0A1Y2GJV9_9FUNG|nr:hypothetical protein BCR41DRAFT_98183 [Lobosporangium transversale]ORZ12937.1 hypothetical protein BCR41DRAFT_98183 [Lobosporangium transversale]|eukprot:XP_021880286.1 hypothetical protein BCR41DRAFT_98183 [Lobosporangium transversale]